MRSAAEDPLSIIGTVIDDRYRVLSLADEGGFSAVYKAEHLTWKQPVALKVFTVLRDAAPELKEKLLEDFVREGKLMSELSSRSAAIVQARDVGRLEFDGDFLPFLVLEWIDGMPLDGVLAREERAGLPPRDIADAMRLLEPVARAVDIAHRRGIAHRDLKPGNILVTDDPRDADVGIKLLDFGIAKVMEGSVELQEALRQTGRLVSAFTPTYGAPEQFSRDHGATGPWTDVFAMALVLVEVLQGGEPALPGDAYFELGSAACDPEARPTPRHHGIDVPAEVEEVFARALTVRAEDRYATMGDFWRALHHVVHPEDTTWRSGGRDNDSGGQRASIGGGPRSESLSAVHTTANPPSRGRTAALGLGGIAIGVAAAVALIGPGVSSDAAASRAGAAAPAALPTATAQASAKAAPAPSRPCPEGMSMLAGGTFEMGSDETNFSLWQPAHQVSVNTYCLDKTEVTVDAYAACVKGEKCTAAATRPDYPKGKIDEETHQKNLAAFAELCNADKPSRGKHPINCVTWKQADTYCKAQGGRLPTEAEWEYAARGTSGRKYPWGDEPGTHKMMNVGGPEWLAWRKTHALSVPGSTLLDTEDGFPGTAPVGSFPRGVTDQGQQDMVGNVWEWTADWYEVYDDKPARNPKGPAAGTRKAIRGGGFNGSASLWLHGAFRYHQLATATSHALGFRCAADVAKAR